MYSAVNPYRRGVSDAPLSWLFEISSSSSRTKRCVIRTLRDAGVNTHPWT